MKKICCFLILMAAVLVIFQAGASADGVTWSLDEGVLTISGSGAIKESVHGKYSSTQRKSITEIVIEEGITGIQSNVAFSKLGNLTKVTLPTTLQSIGEQAFYQCSSLASCNLPSHLEQIGDSAFYMCSKLTDIVLPESLKSIGSRCFNQCTSIGRLTIPDGVQTVGENAFSYSDILIYAKTGTDGAKALGTAGYGYYVTEERKYMLWYSTPDVLEICNVDKDAEQFTIPSEVTKIGDEAFENCKKLKTITLPENVTEIGEKAFHYCEALTAADLPAGLKVIGKQSFMSCKALAKIELPKGLISIGASAFGYDESLTEAVIPDGVTEIDTEVFFRCENLKKVILPKYLTSIGVSAFSQSGIESITIPDTVETIGKSAFYYCKSLKNVRLPAGLKVIPDRCFKECTALESIDLPGTLTDIGSGAFMLCSALSGDITIPEGVTVIREDTFNLCLHLNKVVLPEGLIAVEKHGLACKAEIEKLPDSLESFGDGAFAFVHFGSIRFPKGMSAIPAEAFFGCTLPDHLEIPANIHNIWNKAFSGAQFKSITFDGYIVLGAEAFDSCTSLQAVGFRSGSNTNRIGEDCFNYCIWLKNVYINAAAGSAHVEYYGDDSGKPSDKGNNPLRNATWHFGETYTGQFDPGEAWSEPEYTWDEEKETVTAKRVCACYSGHTQQETVGYTVVIVTQPTATMPGEALYTSGVFTNQAFTTQYRTVELEPLEGYVLVEQIKLNKTSATLTRTLKKAKPTLKLKATISPSDASNKEVTWKSSNTKIATVDKNGKVTALKTGTVKITCTANDGSGKKATCKITIVDEKLTKITLNKKKLTLAKGATYKLKVKKFTPATAFNQQVSWKSSNKKVAKVDKNGKVTALKPGTAKITCTAKDGSGVKAVCMITVTAAKGE